MKAPSRLTTSPPAHHHDSNHRPHHRSGERPWLMSYFTHLPTLFIGLVGYFGCYTLLQQVYPDSIRNWIFPNSYLLFHILVFMSNFFFLSFLLLNTRRGFVWAFLIQIVLFLQLQSVKLTLELLIKLLVLFVIIEVLGTALEKILSSHASLKSKSFPRRRRATS